MLENVVVMVVKCCFLVKKLFVYLCYMVGYGLKDYFNVLFYGFVCVLYVDGCLVCFVNDCYE